MLTSGTLHTADFAIEIAGSLKYFLDRLRNRGDAKRIRAMVTDKNGQNVPRMNFEEAFGFYGYQPGVTQVGSNRRHQHSYDAEARFAPYSYPGSRPR